MRQKQEEGKIHPVRHFRLGNITLKIPSPPALFLLRFLGVEGALISQSPIFMFERKPSANVPSLSCITADRKKLAEKK